MNVGINPSPVKFSCTAMTINVAVTMTENKLETLKWK